MLYENLITLSNKLYKSCIKHMIGEQFLTISSIILYLILLTIIFQTNDVIYYDNNELYISSCSDSCNC